MHDSGAGYPATMFATIVGPYPVIGGDPHAALAATVGDQLDAGSGMLTDGRVHTVDSAAGVTDVVAAWRAADQVGHQLAAAAGIDPPLIKACLVGPWTAGGGDVRRVRAATGHVRSAIEALAEAGAPVVQLTEPGIGDISAQDSDAMARLEEALTRVTDTAPTHLSLALAGGRPTKVPPERLFVAPFASYLFDLINAPDDWACCSRAPAPSGLIVGVGDARTPDADTPEVSIWGARYAASMGGRGGGLVGLCMSAGLERLPRDVARAKLAALADAARSAELSNDALARVVDPRAVDARSAALGRYEPSR